MTKTFDKNDNSIIAKAVTHPRGSKISFIITLFAFLALVFCYTTICEAAGTRLAWDQSPESAVAGYYLHYGTKSGKYTGVVQVAGKSNTSYLLEDLDLLPGHIYYIAITAYTDAGVESAYSNEVVYGGVTSGIVRNVTISGNTVEITYGGQVENATVEANYRFSPSLNFATAGNDIINLGNNTYRLNMASIAAYTIYTLTLSDGIIDAAGNPVRPNQIIINDGDNDDMADDWEIAKGVTDAHADPDNDSLTNVQEYETGTEPKRMDTDIDGLSDGYEVSYGFDPVGNDDANDDPDGDGFTNYQEHEAGSNPLAADSVPAPPSIADPHPHHQAAIIDSSRIPINTSFAVVLSDPCGFDLTGGGCVLFTISVEGYASYNRTLSSASLRSILKIDQNEPDTRVTKLWAVYDISTDSVPEIAEIDHAYPFDKTVTFEVFAQNRLGLYTTATYTIKIETEAQHNNAAANKPSTVAMATSVTLNAGSLCDAQIVFDDQEPVKPSFGPSDELPALDSVVSDVVPVGGALNLLPPTVFNQPVTISIPCPGVVDTSTLNIYYYTGETWILACDSAGNIKPDAEDWMVDGSRQNLSEKIKIQVYHFSGVQAAPVISADSGSGGGGGGGGGSGGGCFIATAAFGSYMEPHVQLLRDFRDLHLLNNTPGRWFVRTYYRYGPIAAHYIISNPYWKPVVRVALIPLAGISYVLVKASFAVKMFITILTVVCALALILRRGKGLWNRSYPQESGLVL
ncbi:MAG: fibronectin type III domain-containing protein [Pseudomonadota bacterium]